MSQQGVTCCLSCDRHRLITPVVREINSTDAQPNTRCVLVAGINSMLKSSASSLPLRSGGDDLLPDPGRNI